jgi:hypothetical protein
MKATSDIKTLYRPHTPIPTNRQGTKLAKSSTNFHKEEKDVDLLEFNFE